MLFVIKSVSSISERVRAASSATHSLISPEISKSLSPKEICPHCGVIHEHDSDSGKCNSCGKARIAKAIIIDGFTKSISRSPIHPAEQWLKDNLGVESQPEKITTRSDSKHFILSNGEITGRIPGGKSAYHGEWAKNALKSAGIESPSQSDATLDIAKNAGTLRFGHDKDGAYVEGTHQITRPQINTLSQFDKSNRGGIQYSVHDGNAKKAWGIDSFKTGWGLSSLMADAHKFSMGSKIRKAVVIVGLRKAIDAQPKPKYGCVMVNPDENACDCIRNWTARHIDESSFIEDGLDSKPHITVKYGLVGSDTAELHRIAAKWNSPIKAKLGNVGRFDTHPDYDVIIAHVDSADLVKLNATIRRDIECVDTFPTYKPHLTLAYVKKGACKELDGSNDLSDMEFEFTKLEFSDKDKNVTYIDMGTRLSKAILIINLDKALTTDQRRANAENQVRDHRGRWAKIIRLTGTELGKTSDLLELRKSAKKYAETHFAHAEYTNYSTGQRIKVPWSALKKATGGASYASKLQSVPAIPALIQHASFEGSEPDAKNRPEIKAIHRYSAALCIGTTLHQARLVVRETKEGHLYYDHNLSELSPGVNVMRTGKGRNAAKPVGKPETEPMSKSVVRRRPTTGLLADCSALDNIIPSPVPKLSKIFIIPLRKHVDAADIHTRSMQLTGGNSLLNSLQDAHGHHDGEPTRGNSFWLYPNGKMGAPIKGDHERAAQKVLRSHGIHHSSADFGGTDKLMRHSGAMLMESRHGGREAHIHAAAPVTRLQAETAGHFASRHTEDGASTHFHIADGESRKPARTLQHLTVESLKVGINKAIDKRDTATQSLDFDTPSPTSQSSKFTEDKHPRAKRNSGKYKGGEFVPKGTTEDAPSSGKPQKSTVPFPLKPSKPGAPPPIFVDDPDINSAINKAAGNLVQLRKFERCYLFDTNGQMITAYDGDEDSIDITPLEAYMEGAVFVHNHPGGWKFAKSDPRSAGNSFSPDDIIVMISRKLSKIVAVSPDFIYEAEPNFVITDIDKDTPKEKIEAGHKWLVNKVVSDLNVLDFDLKQENWKKIGRNKLTIEQAEASHWDIVMTRYAKTGMIKYSKRPHNE